MRVHARVLALALAVVALAPSFAHAALPGLGGNGGPPITAPPPPPEEPSANTWKTWFLASPDELRVAAPPYDTSAVELVELEQLRLSRTAEEMATARHWDEGPANVPWVREELAALARHAQPPPMAARNLALVDMAVYDALIAAWDSKLTFNREGPQALDPTLPALAPRANPSYPSEHAVVAGAASAVLAWLYPSDEGYFQGLATEASESRLWAGLNYRSDVEAGLALGRAVAEKAIAARENDGAVGANLPYTGLIPTGPCKWTPTPSGYAPPWGVLWGHVQPFLMSRADEFRAPPPPACNSGEYLADHYRDYVLSQEIDAERANWTRWWHDHDGLQVAGMFHPLVLDWVLADGLSSPRSARVFALMSGAETDAFISVWESKYVYWTERPIHVIEREFDSSWTPLIETPPFPGYPSGHSAQGGSIAAVLEHLFPSRAIVAHQWGEDDAHAREWAGVHPLFDDNQGLAQGRQVAGLFIDRARSDGAES